MLTILSQPVPTITHTTTELRVLLNELAELAHRPQSPHRADHLVKLIGHVTESSETPPAPRAEVPRTTTVVIGRVLPIAPILLLSPHHLIGWC